MTTHNPKPEVTQADAREMLAQICEAEGLTQNAANVREKLDEDTTLRTPARVPVYVALLAIQATEARDKEEMLRLADEDKTNIGNIIQSVWNVALSCSDAGLDEPNAQKLFNASASGAMRAIVLVFHAAALRALAKGDE